MAGIATLLPRAQAPVAHRRIAVKRASCRHVRGAVAPVVITPPPTIKLVSLVPAVLFSLVLGAVLGAGLAAVVNWGINARRRQRERPPVVDPEVATVIDALRPPAVVVGPHDEVVCANEQARTIGLVRGERIGIHQVLDQVRRAREENRSSVHDVRLASDVAGPARILTARVHPMDRDAVLAIVEDHSAARRADESKRDLVANVSHELKTPVGALQVLAETLQAAADDPEAVRHFAGRMGVESKRLGELVGQIIELSRLQSDDPLLGARVVHVDEVVAQAAARTHDAMVGRDIIFSVTGDKGSTVIGDKEQLANAITNLVANAVSYSDPGARVSVTVKKVSQADDHWIEISVTDNGIGIAPEEQQRVFERFYRVDYARSRADGGTGLGLSIVKHVVAAHGGAVTLWSRPGQGSTFTVRLPENLADEGMPSDEAEK